MIHILIAGHDLKFAKHIIDFLKDNKKYKLRIDKWLSHTDHDIKKSKELLNWAEIIFCEWGLGNAVWYSNNKARDQKLVIRMLGQERLSNLPKEIQYNNVNHIIFVSPHLRQSLVKIFNIPISKTSVIYNFVDSTHFSKPKRKGSIYNLGIVGVSPKLKRLDLAIEIFNKLWMKNSKYHLYIKGKHPYDYPWIKTKNEERIFYDSLFKYIEKLPSKKNIHFEGWSDDLSDWYRKIGYILSTSDFESFHLSVAEGMSSGAVPVVRNWNGASDLYPSPFIFTTIDEAVKIINKNINPSEIQTLTKSFVLKNFEKSKLLPEIEKLLTS